MDGETASADEKALGKPDGGGAGGEVASEGARVGRGVDSADADASDADTGAEAKGRESEAGSEMRVARDPDAVKPRTSSGGASAAKARTSGGAAHGSKTNKPRRRASGKQGRAAVTRAAASAARTLGGREAGAAAGEPKGTGKGGKARKRVASGRRKSGARKGGGRRLPVRDPFDERLRSLEREIEAALREVGDDADPGVATAAQRAGEQLLALYADLARALVEGGVEAAFVRLRMVGTADAVDAFGFDATFHSYLEPLLGFLHDRWWRVETSGTRHVPRSGPVMLVANHSGGVMPYDGLMIAHALGTRRAGRGRVRPLVEDEAYHLPFTGSPLARLGVVRASAANAGRLLDDEQAIVVFPEGAKGSRKYYRDRYRLQRFARGGFVSLALRTQTPLVPVAVVGAEEIYPVLLRLRWLARVLGVPDLPVTPTFPWLGVLGLVPLPTKWRLVFGQPIDLAAEYGADAFDDELLVNQLKESVRERIQRMLIDALRERDSVFTG